MIEFSHKFNVESGQYVLFELPKDLKTKVQEEGSIAIQEFKNDCYIVGNEKLYQLIKYQVSNMMLVCEDQPATSSQPSKLVVRSFQQTTLQANPVRPFKKEILLHLRQHRITNNCPLFKPELHIEYLRKNFVTNINFIKKVIVSS